MSESNLIMIKTGGRPASDPRVLEALLDDIARIRRNSPVILIHGGGNSVSEISKVYGIEPRFVDGIRQTSPEEMDLIDMGLSGLMNSRILRMALQKDIPAVGVSGSDASLFTGIPIAPGSHTGMVDRVRPELLHHLLAAGYLPVVSPVSSSADGVGLNINADDVAAALCGPLKPALMIFISDIPGVLNAGQLIPRLDAAGARGLIDQGIISGGMIPKVNNALRLTEQGTGAVIIGNVTSPGDLERLMAGETGTRIA